MSETIAKLIQRLRNAGFEVEAVRESPLWSVSDHGELSTGQIIDLVAKLKEQNQEAA